MAFDRVEHKYLFSVLAAFGLPPKGISLSDCLYNGMQSEFFVEATPAARFPVTRSVRREVRKNVASIVATDTELR